MSVYYNRHPCQWKITMNTIKILRVSSDKFLLFHGRSLSIHEITRESSLELFTKLSERNNIEDIVDKDFCDYINSITANMAEDSSQPIPRKLRTLVLPISAGCNLTCPYCFAKTNHGNAIYSDYTSIDIDRLLEILEIKCNNEDITIVFFGGEPLMRFDIIKYTVERIRKMKTNNKFHFSITTNGTLINDKILTFFKENEMSILLSIDGFENEYNYRKYKNGKSSVPRVLKSINKLKSLHIPFEIRATITSDNTLVYETFMFLESLQIPYLLAFAYASENTTHKDLAQFGPASYDQIRTELDKLLVYYNNCFLTKQPIYNKYLQQSLTVLENRIGQNYECSAAFMYHTVLSDGTMFSCPHLMNQRECALGKISDWPFKNIEDHDFIPVGVDKIEECMSCWAHQLCHGGCASQKHSMGRKSNQPYLPEKCELDKIMYEFVIKAYYEYCQLR